MQKNRISMPEPVAWLHICRKKPESKALLYGSDSPQLAARGYKPHPLFNSDQLEAYAAAKVREALEEAAQTCEARLGMRAEGMNLEDVEDCDEEAKECAAAIRALIPSTPARPESE